MIVLRECDNCGAEEERCFEDTWTGKTLCLTCLAPIAGQIAMSPATDRDNLAELLEQQLLER